MKVLLSPGPVAGVSIARAYERAFRSARELYIATAFLTDWDFGQRLNRKCERLLFLVGTDFGRTRKDACLRVLRDWLPARFGYRFLAVTSLPEGCFHPKVLAWAEGKGRYFGLIGSSNLSSAGLGTNYEANVLVPLSRREYNGVVQWLNSLAERAQPINRDWLDHYREAPAQRKSGARWQRSTRGLQLPLPRGQRYVQWIRERREQQRAFKRIRLRLLRAMRRCAEGRMSNLKFWSYFWNVWSTHPSRFQGSGIERTGKSANGGEACRSMVRILNGGGTLSEVDLDAVVKREIDRFARSGNQARGAWLSEMLCHYFPEKYPILNDPVKRWLRAKGWRLSRAATQGTRYIELARMLRDAVRQNPGGPRDLAQLDAVVWYAARKSGS